MTTSVSGVEVQSSCSIRREISNKMRRPAHSVFVFTAQYLCGRVLCEYTWRAGKWRGAVQGCFCLVTHDKRRRTVCKAAHLTRLQNVRVRQWVKSISVNVVFILFFDSCVFQRPRGRIKTYFRENNLFLIFLIFKYPQDFRNETRPPATPCVSLLFIWPT